MTNHDAMFQLIFDDKRVMISLLRAYGSLIGISGGWIKVMDLRTLTKLPTNHTSQNLKQRRGDFAWYVKLRKRAGAPPGRGVLIALEHQSTLVRHMAIRLIGYLNMIEQEVESAIHTVGGKRTPGFPIIIYNGKQRWKAPTDSAEIYYSLSDEPVEDVLGSLKHFVL